MTFRYTTPEEDKEIIEMYRSGKYSYQQIGDMKNLSKGTIINIVKGYPYNKDDKSSKLRYNRLQTDSLNNLKDEIGNAYREGRAAYERGNYAAYGAHIQRWVTLQKSFAGNSQIYESLRAERTEFERKAWEAYSIGNYVSFGYHAETWDTLTSIIGDNMKNPWKIVAVKANARSRSKNVKFSNSSTVIKNGTDFLPVGKNYFTHLSDHSWEYIKPILPQSKCTTGRKPIDKLNIMEGILYGLANCSSLRSIPSNYGASRTLRALFSDWYKADVFTDLLEFVPMCPELEAVKLELWAIEKYKLLYGTSIVPHLNEIRKGI